MTLKDCLYIIKSDRKAWIGLLVVVAVGSAAIILGSKGSGSLSGNDEYDSIQMARNSGQDDWHNDNGSNGDSKYFAVAERKIKLQPFDPNTADSTVLLGLGLQAWQVRSIYKYRAAGGVYTCREDFARLYGLSLKKYRELEPYIRIAPEYRPASEVVSSHHTAYRTAERTGDQAGAGSSSLENGDGRASGSNAATNAGYIQKLKAGQTISLNASDTLALRKVPGIGVYFARRIARYREQLGGYVSKEQLLEIQDFPESALPYFEISAAEASQVRKLKINKASAEQLRKHPYISYMMARQIMDYRRLTGNIQSLNDLRLLPTFPADVIEKLKPYIEY